MTTEMVASTLAGLNVTLKGLLNELRELNKHLDDLDRAVGETRQHLWQDGVERLKQAKVLFPDLEEQKKEAA